MVFSFVRQIDIPADREFSSLEADLGVSVKILPASQHSIEILGDQQKHAKAIDIQFEHSKIKIERLKTGLINDWFFWQNNWRHVVQVALFMPTIKSIEAQNGAIVRLVDMQLESPILIAKFGGVIQLENCVVKSPNEQPEFGGRIEYCIQQEIRE